MQPSKASRELASGLASYRDAPKATLMRAVRKLSPGPGLELVTVDRPSPGPDEVLVEVTHASICGTDLHIFNWDEWAQSSLRPPVTVGHEFVGRVAELGSQVSDVSVGSRVIGEGHVVCGQCRNCRSGDPHLCRSTVSIGIDRDGAFADFVVIPATNAYVLPEHIPDDVASIFDPLGNAVHTVLSYDLAGEDVLITGAGPIGQMAAAICRHVGARHIVVTDPSAGRRETAAKMGATMVLSGGDAIEGAMSELGMREGFDVAYEMAGHPAALADIVRTANHGAHVALLGLFREAPTVDINTVIFKGLTVKGIYGREIFETWYKASAMLDSGLDVTPVISHVMPIEDYQEAFRLLNAGDANKVVLTL